MKVKTAGFNDRTWLDMAGHPHSEQLRVTERFRRIDFGHIQHQITFEDPRTLTKPLTLSAGARLRTEYRNAGGHLRKRTRRGEHHRRTQFSRSQTYEGTYEFRGGSAGVAGFMGSTQAVALIDGTLYLNALPLIPQSKTRFDSTGAAAEFIVDTNGAHLILSQTEGDATYDRKP